ncbi:MAG: deoxyhypusine synthase [Planctomycetes bacterium]|nr:deoxyhypusine synthase [Planctomycetota bacterium]
MPDFLHTIATGRIDPPPVTPTTSLTELVENAFMSYNAGRLREACRLFVRKILEPGAVVGVSLSGAMTPAGLGASCLVPLVRAGFIDWIISTGANLYHETHFALGLPLYQSRPGLDDRVLRENQVIRIYDIVFDYRTLLDTDTFFREMIRAEPFQRTMSSAEFHNLAGRYVAERERQLGREPKSLLAVAHELAVPIYTSSPGDSSIGMNIAAVQLEGGQLRIDPSLDVNETAAIVYDAKRRGGASAVVIFGGGSPKNFLLQTEPQIQEVLGLEESGHDYFIQFTDARPDTGGLSGATASEAVTWGKVDPDKLPDSVTCYTDSTIALPILTSYALAGHAPRPPRRLYDQRAELISNLKASYLSARKSGD